MWPRPKLDAVSRATGGAVAVVQWPPADGSAPVIAYLPCFSQ